MSIYISGWSQCKLTLTPDVPWWDYLTHHHTRTSHINNEVNEINAFQEVNCVLTITSKEDKLSQSYESPPHKMYISLRQLCWRDWEMGRDVLLFHTEEAVMPVFFFFFFCIFVIGQLCLGTASLHCYERLQCTTCHQWPNSLVPMQALRGQSPPWAWVWG